MMMRRRRKNNEEESIQSGVIDFSFTFDSVTTSNEIEREREEMNGHGTIFGHNSLTLQLRKNLNLWSDLPQLSTLIKPVIFTRINMHMQH